MIKKKKETKTRKGLKVLLTFLERTKEGQYAPIEESSLPYKRIKEETESIEVYEEEYYYSIS